MAFEWKGVFPALLTPFTVDDKLDLDMYEKNLAAQLEAGVSGIIIGGSLGEASTITEKEKEELNQKLIAGNIPYTEMNQLIGRHQTVSKMLEEKEMRWLELSDIAEN